MSNYIKGEYKRNIYESDTGYIVGLFKVKETDIDDDEITSKTITFTGYFHELNDIDTYIFHGNFVEHDKYGKGVVMDIDGSIATIAFSKAGVKKLLKNHKAIKKI